MRRDLTGLLAKITTIVVRGESFIMANMKKIPSACHSPALLSARPSPRSLAVFVFAALGATPSLAAPDLKKLSLEQLLEVKVVGASKYEQTLTEVAAAASVITRSEIKTFGWRTIEEALSSLPGVYTTYDRQYSYLGMRGFGLPGDYSTRILITINGNRINSPIYDAAPFGRYMPLDMDLVERIEFIPGPGGAVYGQNAMFGVINVVTREGAELDGAELAASHVSPQALREGRATLGKRFDNGIDVLASFSRLRMRGEDRFFDFGASGVSGIARGLDGERDTEAFLRVARGPWSLEHVRGDRRKDDPTAVFLSDPLARGGYQADRYTLTQFRYDDSSYGGAVNLSLRLFAGAERYTSILPFGTNFYFDSPSSWRGAEARALFTGIAGHKLMVGAEAQDNTRLDQAVVDFAQPANNFVIAGSGYRAGIFAQDEWSISADLVATLGMRIDRNNLTGTKSSPRAGLIWRASNESVVKALYGRAYRAPNAYERDYGDGFAQLANPNLGGEDIETLEGVIDHRINRELAVRASVYRWTMRDVITLGLDLASGIPQYQSGHKVRASGVELSVDKTWENGARLRASATSQDAKSIAGGRLVNSPAFLGKLAFSSPLPWAGLRLGYEFRYDSARLTLNGAKLDGYAISDLNLGTGALANGLEVSLRVTNLFDKRYAQPASNNNWQNALAQDGRGVGVKLLYRF
jgi:outer membrane cobalamin receptor